MPKIRTLLPAVFAGLLACNRPLASLDDEVGESGTSESSESESSTSESSTSADTTTDEDSSTFISVGDWGVGEQCMCDSFAQDCPEGEKCVPYSLEGDTWDCTKCVPVLGDQAAGEACSSDGIMAGTDDCDASSWCFVYEGEGSCRGFCPGTVDDPQCAPGSNCWMSNQGSINVCVPACDPMLQDCEQGTGCYLASTIFGCAPESADLSVGEPCNDFNDCAAGLHCAVEGTSCGGEPCCTPFCDIGLGDAECEALPETTCMPLPDPPQGYGHVGLCLTSP